MGENGGRDERPLGIGPEPTAEVESDTTTSLQERIRTDPVAYRKYKARRARAAKRQDTDAGNEAAGEPKDGAASDLEWLAYLNDLHRYLRDQAGAEKDQLLDLRQLREEHWVVGGISEAVAGVRAREKMAIPDDAMWDQVIEHLNTAHGLLSGPLANIEDAKAELRRAVKLFEAAHRKQYEYRSHVEGGAETSASILRGVEIACDITVTILSAGAGGEAVNVMKLGARGVFKYAAEQAGKSLAKTAVKAAVAGGANKLAQGVAEQATTAAVGLDGFDVAKVIRDAGDEAVMNLLGVLVGGALSKTFMRGLARVFAARMPPNVLAKIPPEKLVSGGWRFLVGAAGAVCTTTLLTALSVIVEKLRTGGRAPNGEQFAALVVEQLIQNGLLQIVLTAVTHERAALSEHGEPHTVTRPPGPADSGAVQNAGAIDAPPTTHKSPSGELSEHESRTGAGHSESASARGAAAEKTRVVDPVAGHYEGIDPAGIPHGWTLESNRVSISKAGVISVETRFRDNAGRPGAFKRSYDPVKKLLIMEEAFLHPESPTWVTHDGQMMTSKGTPTQSYWTTRQMREMGIKSGEVEHVKMSTIQNVKTILQIARAKREGLALDAAFLNTTASVTYADTPMTQAGTRIRPGTVKKTQGSPIRVGTLMDYYEMDPAYREARMSSHSRLLDVFGFSRNDEVEYNFSIEFDVERVDAKSVQ